LARSSGIDSVANNEGAKNGWFLANDAKRRSAEVLMLLA
jgi:hypothetical protein